MATHDRSCPSCGAHVSSDATKCDLCGTSIEPSDKEERSEPLDDPSSASHASEEDSRETDNSSIEASDEGQGVFCNQCGWENPPEANFCSQCGYELQEVTSESSTGTRPVSADLPTGSDKASQRDSSVEEDENEQEEMGRQVALVVGGAVVLVLALFFLTQWSEGVDWNQEASEEPPAAQAPAGTEGPSAEGSVPSNGQMPGGAAEGSSSTPTNLQDLVDQTAGELSAPIAPQVDSLRALIEEAPAGEKQQVQAELVNLLIGAGEPGRAAVLQKEVADATGEVEDRRRAADLLYRWMQQLQQEGQRQQVFAVAQHAAETYAEVAEERPEDLDARTRMGEAYLLTNEPMQGIQTINAVLEDDSTFVPARFQKGLALLQINRFDQARQQFEMVRRHAEEDSPFYRQADRAIQVIDEQGGAAGQQAPSGRGTPQ